MTVWYDTVLLDDANALQSASERAREKFVQDVQDLAKVLEKPEACVLMVRVRPYDEEVQHPLPHLLEACEALSLVGTVYCFEQSVLVLVMDSCEAVRDSLLHIRSMLVGRLASHWQLKLDVLNFDQVSRIVS